MFATEKNRYEVDNDKPVSAALLDLSKVFHSISDIYLLTKPRDLNFEVSALSINQSYLTNRIQKVVLPTTSSDWIQLYQGVPQDTIMAPLLFNIYVNSMKFSIGKPRELVQYADDTFFVSSKNSNLGINILENKKLNTYFEQHRLKFNDTKTEFIIFRKKSKNSLMNEFRLQTNDKFYEPSICVKYLGVYVDQNLGFQEEVKHILRKIACAIKTLYSIFILSRGF